MTFDPIMSIKIKIRVNGQEYSSVDEMPDDLRQIYEKALPGGVPSKITFNGQKFSSVDEMPPEIRQKYEAVLGIVAIPLPTPTGIPTPEQIQQIADAIAASRKIEAIKLYRSFTRSDLKSSKEFIETLAVQLNEKDPSRYPLLPTGKGCLGLVLAGIGLIILEILRTS